MRYEGLLLVRATVNLPGLRAGEHALVDPEDPYMRGALRSTKLVEADAAPADWRCLRCGEAANGALLCAACEAEASD